MSNDNYLKNENGKIVPLGTVIHGTLRPQDLLPAFVELIDFVAPAVAAQIMVNGGAIPAHAAEDEYDEWWESDECQHRVEEMFDVLNDYAPEGYVFGAHPGDGSDFGFWPDYADYYAESVLN